MEEERVGGLGRSDGSLVGRLSGRLSGGFGGRLVGSLSGRLSGSRLGGSLGGSLGGGRVDGLHLALEPLPRRAGPVELAERVRRCVHLDVGHGSRNRSSVGANRGFGRTVDDVHHDRFRFVEADASVHRLVATAVVQNLTVVPDAVDHLVVRLLGCGGAGGGGGGRDGGGGNHERASVDGAKRAGELVLVGLGAALGRGADHDGRASASARSAAGHGVRRAGGRGAFRAHEGGGAERQGLNGRDGHILERAGMGGERARRYGRTCSGSAEPSVKATWRAAGDSWPRIRLFPKRPRRAFPEGNHAFYGLATRPGHSSPRCRARARWRRRW